MNSIDKNIMPDNLVGTPEAVDDLKQKVKDEALYESTMEAIFMSVQSEFFERESEIRSEDE